MKLNKYVKINHWFSRSINLERDTSSEESLDSYVITSTAIKTLRLILEAFHDKKHPRSWSLIGPYGSGKSSFGIFLTALFQPVLSKLHLQAIEKLKEVDSELAKGFKKKLTNTETGLNIILTGSYESLEKKLFESIGESIYNLKIEKKYKEDLIKLYKSKKNEPKSSDILDFISKIQSYLSLSKYNFSAITITIDELGKHIEYAGSNASDGDIYILQQLAEHCVAESEIPVFFNVMLHQAIEFYAKELDKETKNEWRKIQGRFEEISFIEGPEQSIRVISKALQHNLTKTNIAKIKKDLKEPVQEILNSKIFPNINKIREGVNFFKEVYPFHPLTSFILPLLAQRFAQNERTVFTFLGSSEAYGFNELADQIDFPEYIMPHHIFDYFVNNQGSYIHDHLTHRRWVEVLNAIERSGDIDSNALNILKTIGLLNIIGVIANFKSSPELLSILYGKKELDKSIEQLTKKSLITYRKHSNEFKVWQGSDFDLEQALNYELEQFEDFDLSLELNNLMNPLPVVAKRHSIMNNSLRYFDTAYISDINLANISIESLQDAPHILILLNQGKTKVANLKKSISKLPKNILLIDVNSRANYEANTKELKALKNIYKNNEDIFNDPIAKKEISDQINFLEKKLITSLKTLTQSISNKWIYKGKTLNFKNISDIQNKLSLILDDLYDKSPVLNNELINKDFISAQGQSARTSLIKKMRVNRNLENLGYPHDKFPPDKTIFNAIFNEANIYQPIDGGFKFAYPDKNHEYFHVYEAIKNILSNSTEPVSFKTISDELHKPPYGIKRGIFPIIFFGFFFSAEANMAIYEDGIFVPYLTDEAIDRIVRKGDHFAFKLHVFEDQDNLISAYSAQFLNKDNKNILSIVRAFSKEIKALPEFTKQTRNPLRVSDEAIKLRSAFYSSKSPHNLFLKDIPNALGYSEADLSEPKKLSAFKELLNNVMVELKSCYEKMLEEQKIFFATNFSLDTNSSLSELQVKIYERYASIEEFTIDSLTLKPFLTRLLQNDIDSEIWFESILTILEKTNPRNWKDETVLEANIKLGQFVERIKDIEKLKSFQDQKATAKDKEIFALRITNQGNVKNVDKIVTLNEEERLAYKKIQAKLSKLLSDSYKDNEKQIAALVALINDIENNRIEELKPDLKIIKD